MLLHVFESEALRDVIASLTYPLCLHCYDDDGDDDDDDDDDVDDDDDHGD